MEETQIKRTKRLLALALAMMMAFAMLAIPAAAHGDKDEDEGIMPLGLVGPCKECGAMISIETSSESKEVRVNEPGSSYTCNSVTIGHAHLITIYRRSYVCPECGDRDYSVNTYHHCYGGQ